MTFSRMEFSSTLRGRWLNKNLKVPGGKQIRFNKKAYPKLVKFIYVTVIDCGKLLRISDCSG